MGRQVQLFNAGDFTADGTDNHAHFAPLLKHVDAKTAHLGQGNGQVQLQVFFKLRHLSFIHDGVGNFLDQARWQAGAAQWLQYAFNLDIDGCARTQKHIRGIALLHDFQKMGKIHECGLLVR